jgi:hypothetical protein
MKSSIKILLGLVFIFSLFPSFSSADIITHCINSSHDPAVTGPFANTDCDSYKSSASQNTGVTFFDSNTCVSLQNPFESFSDVPQISDYQFNTIFPMNGSGGAYTSCVSDFDSAGLVDGDGAFLYIPGYTEDTEIPSFVNVIYYRGHLFDSWTSAYAYNSQFNSTTTATYTESSLGSLNIGIGIIIVLFTLFVISFIWNQLRSKKPWHS